MIQLARDLRGDRLARANPAEVARGGRSALEWPGPIICPNWFKVSKTNHFGPESVISECASRSINQLVGIKSLWPRAVRVAAASLSSRNPFATGRRMAGELTSCS